MATPTNEHVEALAAAMSARPLDHYRHGGEHEEHQRARLPGPAHGDGLAAARRVRERPRDLPAHLGGEHMTRCPLCGATVRSLTRESGGRWSLGCGDWITDQQAAPILAARGDDT